MVVTAGSSSPGVSHRLGSPRSFPLGQQGDTPPAVQQRECGAFGAAAAAASTVQLRAAEGAALRLELVPPQGLRWGGQGLARLCAGYEGAHDAWLAEQQLMDAALGALWL